MKILIGAKWMICPQKKKKKETDLNPICSFETKKDDLPTIPFWLCLDSPSQFPIQVS